MIIIDTALAKRQADNNPIRVGLVGAGYMGRGIALQIVTAVPGMKLVAVANRHLADAHRAYTQAGVDQVQPVETLPQLENAISQNQYAITEDALLLARCALIDVIIEATGTIDFGAAVVLTAVDHHKHVVMMNAELDATLGPILKVYANRAGVVLTNSDGDQPGVIMNLFRYVQAIGCRPVLAGNMKGVHDPYRTPATQRSYAERYKQKPHMVTSFADGTKISMEMAVVAKATGFPTDQRGMYGPDCDHVDHAAGLFPKEEMRNGGLVDYVVGAQPGGGVFIIGYNDNLIQQQYLNYYKMGEGPFYVFYTPYHLCHLETPFTAARAVLFGDAALTPLGGPVCDVVTAAKRNLKAGETIDGFGGFMSYGCWKTATSAWRKTCCRWGWPRAASCATTCRRIVCSTYADVSVPPNRLSDRLRTEQTAHFAQPEPSPYA